ncbi:hypothetical protein G647_01751 [Cladophialophora carrionii CBS 160.54]|uniref:Uncharacterized protein n=1 Tax=Cladophialophora carrionii CBS 160.54 TaxID=1279043 RepID=V9DSI4_9EURO|nr:uncharacterized protein G647_01751 [Cladophialophora carrionii CBS 160.54]ETI29298.1 hypothetical protein G647_01751 [Cladophialophora carrionii CBS 160.54]
MMVLKNTEMNPDWKIITAEAGISRTSNAQRKFRQIIEAAGYKLVNNQIVDPDEDQAIGNHSAATATAAATATQSPSPSPAPAPAPQGRKRKSAMKKDATEEAGVKKRKTSQHAGDSKRDGDGEEEIKAEAADEEV